MQGAPHHQGNLTLSAYAARWVCRRSFYESQFFYISVRAPPFMNLHAFVLQSAKNDGQPCSQFKAYALAHKSKAEHGVAYDPNDPASAYTNENVKARLDGYTSMAKEIHGQDFDPSEHDIDGEVVMMAGGGKKHGRFWIGDGTLDTASTPSLSQLRARSTSSGPAIRPRPEPTRIAMTELQVSSISFILHGLHMLCIGTIMRLR